MKKDKIMLLDSFLEYLKHEKNYSPNTIVAYKKDLESFKEFCFSEYSMKDLEKIHYNQIRSWLVTLIQQDVSNRTVNRKVSSLRSFYKFLQKTGDISISPLAKHKSLKVQKKEQIPFTQKEVNEVIASLDVNNDFVSVRNKLMVELFYSTGIRRVELVNIKEKNIDFNNKLIKVLGKRNKERYVPLLPSVLETLKKYNQLREKKNTNIEEFFVTEKGAKIYETLVYRVINLYFSQVSTKVKKSPHILRHTFATEMLNEGADLNSVKELLGHSSLASTQVYTHNNLEKMKEMFNNTHPRSKKNDS